MYLWFEYLLDYYTYVRLLHMISTPPNGWLVENALGFKAALVQKCIKEIWMKTLNNSPTALIYLLFQKSAILPV